MKHRTTRVMREAISQMNATIDALEIKGAIWGTGRGAGTNHVDAWTCFLSGIYQGRPFRYECPPEPCEHWAIVECAVRAEMELDSCPSTV